MSLRFLSRLHRWTTQKGLRMRVFANRDEAGELLGAELRKYHVSRPVILGIPRGGIPIAVAAARLIPGAEVGVIVARKLGAPGSPELAIGAVASDGSYYLDEELARDVGADDHYINEELQRQQREAQRREARFDGSHRPALEGRNVIVVDDGVATGATAIASIRSARSSGAASIWFAVPVGPVETIRQLEAEADEVICIHQPMFFWAVGQFYTDFSPVEDEQAIRLLQTFRVGPAPATDESETGRAV